jgi:predicted transposase YbfD/YdcC
MKASVQQRVNIALTERRLDNTSTPSLLDVIARLTDAHRRRSNEEDIIECVAAMAMLHDRIVSLEEDA